MNIIAGIVTFSSIWWLIFFMTVSQELKIDDAPLPKTAKSVSESFSFKQQFLKVTKITSMVYITLDLLIRYDCLLWILN